MTALLAPDPAVPQRDALLDERRMGALLGTRADRRRGRRLRAREREVPRRRQPARRLPGRGGRRVAHRRRAHVRRPQRERLPARRRRERRRRAVPAVLHAPELETVFWTFPNDRRLAGLRLLDGRSGALDRLVGRPVARTRLVAYAPERAATAECLDARRARARLREGPLGRRGARARQREAAAAAVGPATRTCGCRACWRPRCPTARSCSSRSPAGGSTGSTTAELGPALRALGAGLATLHARPPAARRGASTGSTPTASRWPPT